MALFTRKKSTTPATPSPAATSPAAAPVAVLDRDAFGAATQAVGDVAGSYDLDVTHSRVGFSARHAMVTTVRGAFTDFAGEATIDTAEPARSSVDADHPGRQRQHGPGAARRPPAHR